MEHCFAAFSEASKAFMRWGLKVEVLIIERLNDGKKKIIVIAYH